MSITLVTGASGGIGQAVVRACEAEGRLPLCVGRSMPRLSGQLEGRRLYEADVRDASQAQALFATLESEGLLPDALIHCVGSTLTGSFERISTQQYLDTLSTNLGSAIAICQPFFTLLKKHKREGSVVLFSSVVARIGLANHEIIAAAKAGLEGFAISAAASYAASGIRINVIAPGLTETPLTAPLLSSELGRSAASKQYPLVGINTADDIAQLACWLSSAKASRITGQVIAVDGGFSRIRPLIR